MAKLKKTNAVRLLEREEIPFRLHEYDKSDGRIDGISVAEKIGMEPATVFKTLVAQGASRQIHVFVIPVTGELDLKKAAAACGEKKIQMIPVKDILPLTGYIRGGCSPIGMKKHYPTHVDQSARDLERMVISAGQIGMQIELAPEDLVRVTAARWSDLTEKHE